MLFCIHEVFEAVNTAGLKLVSHWHANSSRLFREFSRGTFARHSCECHENFHVSRTSRKLVAKVLNMFKNWMRIFFPKYFARLSRDCRATVALRSCESREPVAAKFWRIYNAKFSRQSYECRASVARRRASVARRRATVLRQHAKNLRLPGEKIKLSVIRTNVVRHSHECRATVVRIKMKIRYIRGKVVRHSHECRATIARQS